jgi:phosphoribosylformylglycinamidine (FGAM) synthase-like enzyme
MSDKIIVQIDGKNKELKGAELEAFLEQRLKDQAEFEQTQRLIEAEQTKKDADRVSAMAKLSKLGLTDDEIASLIP